MGKNSLAPGPIEGDFAVSDFFSPSGFMGDGATRGQLTQSRDENCAPRKDGAEGSCFHFTYRVGDEGWSGVYFQYPANNWGSEPGRAVASRYQKVRFEASARYEITYPSGAGIGQVCQSDVECRPGLLCEAGTCAPAHSRTLGQGCLVSDECESSLQCIAQKCTPAGTFNEGESCGAGRDELCAAGLHCGVVEGHFACTAPGPGDVFASCESRNDCRAGLVCQDSECRPRTLMGPLRFMVGGIQPTEANFSFADEIGVEYTPRGGQPQPLLGPEPQTFEIDLSGVEFSEIIGGFMWSTAFPDVDLVRASGPTAYKANLKQAAHLYFDDIVFVSADGSQVGVGGAQ